MSSRALRKAQREREEQERLRQSEDAASEEEDARATISVKNSAFAMLGEQEDEDEPVEEDEAEQDNVTAAAAAIAESAEANTSKPPSKKKKKKKKVKTTPSASQLEEKEEDIDEIDKALKELSANGGSTSGETAGGQDTSAQEACRLLAVDVSNLHAANEMRRLFGRTAMEQPEDDDEGGQGAPQVQGANRRQQRRVQQVGLAQMLRAQRGQGGSRAGGLSALSLRRNIFIQGREEWPVATGGGLGMEVVEKRADGTVEYRYVHNSTYQGVQSQFDTCVASMDPNRLVRLLQLNPYHISTLLQVSEIAKQERDHATSGDLLERALFSLGRAVHSTFAKNIAEGKARLDFGRPENRELWLAASRYMQNLSMRATWRTVHEWAKLLLSLSPEEDPYRIWLVLDQYALRARQDLDYLNMSRAPQFQNVHRNTPNVQLSQGLAEFRAGNKSKGRQVLFRAVGRFPWVVTRLMQELAIDPPPAIWGKEPRTQKEKLFSELYATRAKDIWNTPETSALLVEVSSALPPETPPAEIDDTPITADEARHVLLTDTPALIALIPRKFTAALASTSDPLPPTNNIQSYSPSASNSTFVTHRGEGETPGEDLRELQGLQSFFRRIFPWFDGSQNGGQDPTDDAEETDGTATAEAARGRQDPNEEDVARSIAESGVSEEVIVARTQRMMELQRRLMGDEEMMEQRLEAINAQDEEDNRRARVEDAADEER
ncbi:DUF654-domain-containing protein [Polychaeton citri CBS 116435]|uniref:DUF654-domain-containing protein n=1 Tax=Polychaeton citri CBS 116435 TaxID=1314669 RepID=A0A9P4Q098_9PEZI|nr:DUF654-domain-containing protein [Polychaeton citri CBS 116435]